jgi:hypothetical protein
VPRPSPNPSALGDPCRGMPTRYTPPNPCHPPHHRWHLLAVVRRVSKVLPPFLSHLISSRLAWLASFASIQLIASKGPIQHVICQAVDGLLRCAPSELPSPCHKLNLFSTACPPSTIASRHTPRNKSMCLPHMFGLVHPIFSHLTSYSPSHASVYLGHMSPPPWHCHHGIPL